MKGITPVIAIILLLLITISLVGFAFIYFTRVTEIAATRTEEQLQHVINSQQMVVAIDNLASPTLIVRNMGSGSFGMGNVSIYVDNVLTTCLYTPPQLPWNPFVISPGSVSSCILPTDCTGKTVRITSPAGEDSEDC